MRINEVKETREVVVKTEYIAIDGTVFATKEMCEQWEKSYKCTLNCSMAKIPHIVTNGEDAYLQCGQCDEEVWIIKPRDFADIKVINAYVEEMCFGCRADLTHEDIGKLIALNFSYDHDWCGVYKVDKYLNDIKKQYESYEKIMEEKANA